MARQDTLPTEKTVNDLILEIHQALTEIDSDMQVMLDFQDTLRLMMSRRSQELMVLQDDLKRSQETLGFIQESQAKLLGQLLGFKTLHLF